MISLKLIHRSAAAKASHYYAEQADDYYSKDGTSCQWQGKAAAAFGLEGTVAPVALRRALRGDFGPHIKLSRSVRLDSKARAALDITFSPPKSISIQALVAKDGAVIRAHDTAVTRALDYLESELVRARHSKDGVTTMERTANAAIAKFRHETARPTAGAYSDPQLHTHALLMNITQRADGTWTAISNDDIYRLKSMVEAIYHAELANELEKLGHRLRYERDSFELTHFTREQLEAFSKRSGDITDELAAQGQTRQSASRALKQTIALKTRSSKSPDLDRAALQQDWERQSQALGLHFAPARHPTKAPRVRSPEADALCADQCLRWAIKHHTERECVMDGREMLATALRYSHGTGIQLSDLKAAVARSIKAGHLILGTVEYRVAKDHSGQALSREAWVGRLCDGGLTIKQAKDEVRRSIASGELIPTGARYTTQIAREREKRILQIEREGRASVAPVLSRDDARAALADRKLKPGQLAAAELILGTDSRFVGVQGLAGTGKSHMLGNVKKVAETAGYTLQAVASYGRQIEALRVLGMEARTVASVLAARQKHRFKLEPRTILVIDEAGVVPVRIMERLMKMAEADGARVVMLGDTGQTKAIEAGRPFHQLQDEGMATALMDDIVRQQSPELKGAVELAAQGKASAALAVLDHKLKAVHSIDGDSSRYETIARTYAARSAEERAKTLIVTGTNSSRNAINDATHRALGLSGRGFEFPLLTRRDTTQAERRVAKYYVPGDIIQPERDYAAGNLRQGELYRVIGPTADKVNELEVEHITTKLRTTFNPARAVKMSVYQPVDAELSAGDWVRVTRNNASLDLVNGARFEVLAVTPTSVTIAAGGRRVVLDASRGPLHLDRAYASTSHSAQGLTCDSVLVNAESFSRTTQRDVYYVAISRAKHEAEIFTDSVANLAGVVDRLEEKTAAFDIELTVGKSPQNRTKERSMEIGS